MRLALLLVTILIAAASPGLAIAGRDAPLIAGARTTGGEGGKTITVSNLDDHGPGSLRAALDIKGPRIIRFAVAGVIRLERPLWIRQSWVTIAGETAPSPGITLWAAPVRIRAHDVIVRHLRIRVGDGPGAAPDDRDGIAIAGEHEGQPASRNILIDHCSVSWAIDENVSLWFPDIRAVTIRHSIIAEGLNRSLHSKGSHSTGLLVGSGAQDVVIQGNLFAHNRWRNPVLTEGVTAVVVNNLIYDGGDTAVHFYDNKDKPLPTLVSIVGNVVRKGPSSKGVFDMWGQGGPSPGSRVYLEDNDGGGTNAFDARWHAKNRPASRSFVSIAPIRVDADIRIEPAAAVTRSVLDNAGARPWDRDATDKRLIAEVMARGGTIRDTVPIDEVP